MHIDDVNSLTHQIQNLNFNEDGRRSAPYISLRDAAETILPFDGKNMPVSQFINNCTHAKNMVSPTAEYGLVQMIKNKLVGPALRVALSEEYNDIESLLNCLKTRFAPVYSTSQLHGELSKIMQYPDETVVDYGSRVSMILHQLKSTYQGEHPNQATQFIGSAETNAVKNFLTGLNNGIYTRLQPREISTLNNAIEFAIKAETDYNEHRQRTKIAEGLMQSLRCNNCFGYGHESLSCSTVNPLARVSHVQWQPKVCTFCKKVGHVRAQCRALQPQSSRRNLNVMNNRFNQQYAVNNRNVGTFCRYCKTPGHTLDQCRKRQYNNERYRSPRPPENQNHIRSNNNNNIRNATQGNQERVQRVGAALNERPRVRHIAQGQQTDMLT
ncbi:hypothetical protein ALC62_06627 [Cyphomyrmex costatus]|uniref:CCHC-type domain-containing protein n=1 Tax=Cyphomyrmex costatus TaxID=456900 RepID=A0A151IIS6_9HYME|nr:hypothetical protein ALC62_06627 [Cyphomyrmex costatus]